MISVKHLAQCLMCGSSYTMSGRLRVWDFLGLFPGSLVFFPCKRRRLENVVIFSFSDIVLVPHEIYGIIFLKRNLAYPQT